MTYTSTTYSHVPAFGDRAAALVAVWRGIFGSRGVSFAALATVATMLGAVTMAATWMIVAAVATYPKLHARVPLALQTAEMIDPYRTSAGAANIAASSQSLNNVVNASRQAWLAELTPAPTLVRPLREAQVNAVTVPTIAPRLPPRRPAILASRTPLQPRPAVLASRVPLPRQRPHQATVAIAQAPTPPVIMEIASVPAAPTKPAAPAMPPTSAAPQIAAAKPEPPKPAAPKVAAVAHEPPRRELPKPAAPKVAVVTPEPPKPAHDKAAARDADNRTAVYDIAAHTVYLPNGKTLEAHSGLGHRLDDPRFAAKKNRGPTPPNVYELTLRERLFHGVRAIRLNPVDEDKMHGRDGMLAHTYMLGPTGQSYGCVSFKNYKAFLQAYLKGEVNRLVVVPHLEGKPSDVAQSGRGKRYAFND
jgi:Tlde1 domain